ncbi:uncharacterized protein MP3633_0151 [Marinomonas primoryensis]|uniref:Uncharacterized protein n=1 Tax=Marinomonas primoryensis TaxID=178399 RepID=A0A859CWW0_9GAMM|nr:uncharacterized protein MP3633_0151 [Marinomonas primoryensis]
MTHVRNRVFHYRAHSSYCLNKVMRLKLDDKLFTIIELRGGAKLPTGGDFE